jgi:hypothetical protein
MSELNRLVAKRDGWQGVTKQLGGQRSSMRDEAAVVWDNSAAEVVSRGVDKNGIVEQKKLRGGLACRL